MSCKVYVREKPKSKNCNNNLLIKENSISISSKKDTLTFAFEKVFSPGENEVVFKETCSSLVESSLDGYNATLLCYGASNSGKTYTSNSIISQSATKLLNLAKSLELSVLEVYNDSSIDLLAGKYTKGLSNLSKLRLNTIEEFETAMKLVHQKRRFSSTDLNSNSSRSHIIYCFTVSSISQKSRLIFGDLAGSENCVKAGTRSDSEKLQESKHINKSLLQIGNVIQALVKNDKYIPYRNSVLTHILKGNLTKDCIISLILCISGNESDSANTRKTLSFGSVAAKMVCRPIRSASIRSFQSVSAQTDHDFVIKSLLHHNTSHSSLYNTRSLSINSLIELTSLSDSQEDICNSGASQIDLNVSVIKSLHEEITTIKRLYFVCQNNHFKNFDCKRSGFELYNDLSDFYHCQFNHDLQHDISQENGILLMWFNIVYSFIRFLFPTQ
eukprot:NODE_129_length_16972_cov_2.172643.p3 type:complete len:442 gc:universal NODE_129_length_16972_cov_2.172643:13310-11985(-)